MFNVAQKRNTHLHVELISFASHEKYFDVVQKLKMVAINVTNFCRNGAPYISIALNLPYNKNKLHRTLDYWSRVMLNFNFSKKGLGLVSPPHCVYDFSRKMFLMLHSINRPNFIVWLPSLLEILGNMCISILC